MARAPFSASPMIGDIRRALIMTVAAAIFHIVATTASRTVCIPWMIGFADAMPTEIADAGRCVAIELAPSPLVMVGLPGILVVALTRVLTRALSVLEARAVLERAVVAMWALVGVAFVVTRAWLLLHGFPLEDADGYVVVPPIPFGSAHIEEIRVGWTMLG